MKYILLLLCTSYKLFANPCNFYECINTRNDLGFILWWSLLNFKSWVLYRCKHKNSCSLILLSVQLVCRLCLRFLWRQIRAGYTAEIAITKISIRSRNGFASRCDVVRPRKSGQMSHVSFGAVWRDYQPHSFSHLAA